jgi:hypothetical protein
MALAASISYWHGNSPKEAWIAAEQAIKFGSPSASAIATTLQKQIEKEAETIVKTYIHEIYGWEESVYELSIVSKVQEDNFTNFLASHQEDAKSGIRGRGKSLLLKFDMDEMKVVEDMPTSDDAFINRYYGESIKVYNQTIDLEKYAGHGTIEHIENILEKYLLEKYGMRKGNYILSIIILSFDKDSHWVKDEYLLDGRQIGKTRSLFQVQITQDSIDIQNDLFVIRVTDKEDLGKSMVGRGPRSCTVGIERNTLRIVNL